MRREGKSFFAALILASAVFHPSVASAKTYIIQTIGAWKAFGGTDEAGVPICGLSNAGADRVFAIKYWANGSDLSIQVFKNSWNIPSGAHIAIELQFDRYDPWSAEKGLSIPPDGIQFNIKGDQIEQFFREFSAASRMAVRFPSGSEPNWDGGLSGTAALSAVFADCILKLKGAPTQPYSSQNTQPYANGPSQPVTQPYYEPPTKRY